MFGPVIHVFDYTSVSATVHNDEFQIHYLIISVFYQQVKTKQTFAVACVNIYILFHFIIYSLL